MNLSRLLDPARVAVLRRRLDARMPAAPANALLSLTLDLGNTRDDSLASVFSGNDSFIWSQPGAAGEDGLCRLAFGQALMFSSAGEARFAALQAAFTGIAADWQHDDSDATGAIPAAHIGFAFDEEAAEKPDSLPNARLIVPAVLLERKGGRTTVTYTCLARNERQAIAHWQKALRAAPVSKPQLQAPAALQRKASPLGERAFLARTQAALAEIAQGSLEKIVLTRSAQFDAGRAIAIPALLDTLIRRYPECIIYGVGHHQQTFLGATPEHLIALRHGTVRADALAGTAWLCAAAPERPGSLQLQDNKNRREQQLVVDAVRAALAPLCDTLAPPAAPRVVQIRNLQHLRTRIEGHVKQDVGLFDLIDRLHPTPAVGGTPDAAARQWLRTHGDQRGTWYTGGIGWIDRHGDGEIAVALRCANIRGTQAELFAGAGIVAGSDPAQELAETEVKFGAMAEALQHTLTQNKPDVPAASFREAP